MDAKVTERGYALVIGKLTKLDSVFITAMSVGLARGLLICVAMVQREYLQGPRPLRLGEITTRLRNSIASQVSTNGASVTGRIGSNVRYAAYHEFGFHGLESVKAFNRVTSRVKGPGKGTFGPLVLGKQFGSASGGKAAARKDKSGFVTFESVRAHQRKVDYAGRPFVAPALQRSLPVIISEIKAEIGKAANG